MWYWNLQLEIASDRNWALESLRVAYWLFSRSLTGTAGDVAKACCEGGFAYGADTSGNLQDFEGTSVATHGQCHKDVSETSKITTP